MRGKTNFKPVEKLASRVQRRVFLLLAVLFLPLALMLCIWAGSAYAGPLADRLAAFPAWEGKPPVQPAEGDLIYPPWFAGSWKMTSTLTDLVAPLAPDVVTPGFESNRHYLNQPISCEVRFVESNSLPKRRQVLSMLPIKFLARQIVADRAFNGLNLAKAYLGDHAVLAVNVDPSTPNRQVTLLHEGRQLVSVVTARAVETPAPDRFVTTEVFQQVFRGIPNPYLNQVETATAYQQLTSDDPAKPQIVADQITAVYLSPQDPAFFEAGDQPVALYRYRLELTPTSAE